MQIVKLNCTACGAPISIPEDIDILFCASCGSKLAVDRGEGYVTLKLIEKLTQAIQESGDKSHSAIKENTYVTKVELKRVQISQSINTEEMKLNTIRQEIRSLTRKPQLIPVELQQLTTLRLDECSTLMRIRKLNMDSAKLEEGWEESMEVFENDLTALIEIINGLNPYTTDPSISSRLAALNQERTQCENHLTELETLLLTRQLKSLKYAPLANLSVEEMEKLNEDLQSDLNLLVGNPQTAVKTRLRTELNALLTKLSAIYPRMKVESVTGELKSLDLKTPYPEIPWQLIPLIELAESDLEKVHQSPDNPSKIAIKNQIGNIARDLKALQALDLPSQRVLAEKKRKQKSRITSTILLSMTGIIILVIIILISGSKKDKSSPLALLYDTPKNSEAGTALSQNEPLYQVVETELFEVVAQRTYLRAEPDINSPELDPIVHGEFLFNLGQASTARDWYQVQSLSGDLTGYLYQQWISPVHGKSVDGTQINLGGSKVYVDDFSQGSGTWFEDSFDDDYGKGTFAITNQAYQVDINAREGGYIYSKIDLTEIPSNFTFSVTMNHLSGTGLSGAGLITNFNDPDNFDYILLTSDHSIVIGCIRNGVSTTLYNTESSPNSAALPINGKPNQLSVWVESDGETGPNKFTYALNGKAVYSLEFDTAQKYSPTIGVIIWPMDASQPVSYTFDNITVLQPGN
ncbi:MAG: hypothetical protein ACYDH2_10170 [Anaerolineaceae bacterium]